jgi:hypothetical protein
VQPCHAALAPPAATQLYQCALCGALFTKVHSSTESVPAMKPSGPHASHCSHHAVSSVHAFSSRTRSVLTPSYHHHRCGLDDCTTVCAACSSLAHPVEALHASACSITDELMQTTVPDAATTTARKQIQYNVSLLEAAPSGRKAPWQTSHV